jgi:aldehyde:ferredoxin oxidoreductase
MTADELKKSGERINTIARLINIREGLSRKDDTLPWKVFNTPIPDDGPVKGARVTEKELDLLLDDYYQSRGWNLNGVPIKEKLEELNMSSLLNIVEEKQEA